MANQTGQGEPQVQSGPSLAPDGLSVRERDVLHAEALEVAKHRWPWQGPLYSVQRLLHRHAALGPLLVLVLSAVVFELLHPGFLRLQNISLMLQQLSVLGSLAIGQTMIMLTAGIDLSVGAMMILAQMIMGELAINAGVNAVLALVIGVAFGGLMGLLNGGLTARVRLPPFIVTLGTLGIFTAIGLRLSGGATLFFGGSALAGSSISSSTNALLWTGTFLSVGSFTITTGVLLMVGLYLVFGYVLAWTSWGRHVYAVGDNAEAARLAGVRVRSLITSVYVVAGLIYGIAAWVQIGRVGSVSPDISSTLNLDSITAVVIGGTSLFGGRGVLMGTLFGALIVQVFDTGLELVGVNALYLPLAEGILVISAVALDHWIRAIKD
ncbi:MAG: ABC transporter permease [Acidimicrobiales bacterium]